MAARRAARPADRGGRAGRGVPWAAGRGAVRVGTPPPGRVAPVGPATAGGAVPREMAVPQMAADPVAVGRGAAGCVAVGQVAVGRRVVSGGAVVPRVRWPAHHRRPARATEPVTPSVVGAASTRGARRVTSRPGVTAAGTPVPRAAVRTSDGAGVGRAGERPARRTSGGAVAPGVRSSVRGLPMRGPAPACGRVPVLACAPAGRRGSAGRQGAAGRTWRWAVRRWGWTAVARFRAGASGWERAPGGEPPAGHTRAVPAAVRVVPAAVSLEARLRRQVGSRGFPGTAGRCVRRDAARRARRARRW